MFFMFCTNFVFASPRDTLKGNEGLPVFATIHLKNNSSFNCYIEYHELIKEYFNKGVYAYIRTCTNYKFHNKDITNVYTKNIDSFTIGHDFYKRILSSNSVSGILTKQIINYPLCVYEYKLDDFDDLKISDSLEKIAFGIGAKNNLKEFLIFEFNQQFYVYSINESNTIELPIVKSYTIIYSNVELIALLKNKLPQYTSDINELADFFSIKELKVFLKNITNENKK